MERREVSLSPDDVDDLVNEIEPLFNAIAAIIQCQKVSQRAVFICLVHMLEEMIRGLNYNSEEREEFMVILGTIFEKGIGKDYGA